MRIRWFTLPFLALWATSCQVNAQPVARGLGSLFHPLHRPDGALAEQAQAIPQEQKDRVHFFLINGLDPAYSANLNGLAAYYRSIGFTNTTSLQMPAASKLRKRIDAIRSNDSDARIVLLGYSWGANIVRNLANSWERDGLKIDGLVYLGGDMVYNSPSSRPGNVRRIINITGNGLLVTGGNLTFKGEDIEGAMNHRLKVPHLSLPSNREAIELIGKELIAQATKSDLPPAVTVAPPSQTPPLPKIVERRTPTVPAIPAGRSSEKPAPLESKPVRIP